MKKLIALVLFSATYSALAPIKSLVGSATTEKQAITTLSPLQKEVEVVEVEEIKNQDVYQDCGDLNLKKLGTFKLTAYCPCKNCSGYWGSQTSTGTKAQENRTIAVDPSVIAYGTHVLINGVEYVAEDCGEAVQQNHIDIYFEHHYEAVEFGVQEATVFEVLK